MLVKMSSVPARSRPRKGARTRLRLLQATLNLIERDGLASLTTARITGEAGLAQPSFYQYFRSLDACLTEAGRYVASRILPPVPDLAGRAAKLFQGDQNLAAVIELVVSETVEAYLAEPALTKLYLRHQHDPSAFGRAMDEALEWERVAVVRIWWDCATQLGAGPELYPAVAVQARLVMSMSQGAVRAIVYGEFRSRELVLGQLRLMIQGAIEKDMLLLGTLVAQTEK